MEYPSLEYARVLPAKSKKPTKPRREHLARKNLTFQGFMRNTFQERSDNKHEH